MSWVKLSYSRINMLLIVVILVVFYKLVGRTPDAVIMGARSPGKVLDCRTWEEQDYESKTDMPDVHDQISLAKEEKPELRLEGWKNAWVNGEHENAAFGWPKSGPGSTLENSQNMRESLATIIDRLKILLNKRKIRVLDAPCGDMTWMSVFLSERKDVIYSGYDIIPQNIENAKEKYSHETWYFRQLDMLKDQIRGDYDLVVNRHVSIHLSLVDSIQMFHNIQQSKSKFLVTTTFPDVTLNDDLYYAEDKPLNRGFHRLNLELYPFHFPTPICINPDSKEMNQHMALWRLDDLTRFHEENLQAGRFRPFNRSSIHS